MIKKNFRTQQEIEKFFAMNKNMFFTWKYPVEKWPLAFFSDGMGNLK